MKPGRCSLWPLLALTLTGCAPGPAQSQAQPVEIWEGRGQVLLREQHYRATFTVNPRTHELSGTLENLDSHDRFLLTGTRLPVNGAEELTAYLSAGGGARVGASVLGLSLSGVSLKADAVLSGRVVGDAFNGSLRINGVAYGLELRRVKP